MEQQQQQQQEAKPLSAKQQQLYNKLDALFGDDEERSRAAQKLSKLNDEMCNFILQLPATEQGPALLLSHVLQSVSASVGGRTAYQALNASLPQGATDWLQFSSSSTHGLGALHPHEVLAWQHTEPEGHAGSLDQAILAYQGSADKRDRGLARPPATLGGTIDSEAEVASWLQAWVADPLRHLAQQVSLGATWKQLPQHEILQDALIRTGAHEVTSTVEGQQVQSVTPSQPQDNYSFKGGRDKTDFALLVQEQPSEGEALQQGPKRRCVCVGVVQKPVDLLSTVEDLPDLVTAYQQQDSERHREATAVLNQTYTRLQLCRLCYAFISCWFGTWLVYCPPQQRDKLYVSRPYSASSAAPAVTVMGALAWLQTQALKIDPDSVAAYTPPGDKPPFTARAGGGGGEGSAGSSGPDCMSPQGAPCNTHSQDLQTAKRQRVLGCEEQWATRDQQGPHDEHNSRSGGGSAGAGGSSSSQPQQPGGMVTLLLQHKLQQGSAGAVVAGSYGGLPAVVKLLGPDMHGLAVYETESAVYSALAAFQGTLVPRLLGTGSLAGGVVRFIATSKVDGAPLSSLPIVSPATATAALGALDRLHRECGGFLHGDIRLANVMVLAGQGGDSPPSDGSVPQCMLLDFGRSRVDGSRAEQRREYRQLKRLLGA